VSEIHGAELELDLRADAVRFAEEVRRGLSASPKAVPARWLLDVRGAALHDLLRDQPEHYPARVEAELLEANARDLADAIGPDALVIEHGAAAPRRSGLLLGALARPAGYVPVDLSREALLSVAEAVGRLLPRLPIRPVVADAADPGPLPLDGLPCARRVAFLPAPAVEGLEPQDAVAALAAAARRVGPGGALVVGLDLPKDERTLVSAWDDARGAAAAFQLNLLARMNRELDGDFRLSAFRHRPAWNARGSRLELHLEATSPQLVHVAGATFSFAAGETLHTRSAYRWEPRAFDALAAIAGWRPERTWSDERAWFAVKLYRAA
jgi:L-histidine N-alpha-methyltransferase